MPQHRRYPLLLLPQQEFFNDKKQEKVQSPQHIVPAGAMPQAGQAPHNEQVEELPPLAPAVAAQRDIHIIPEEGGKRNVPPPPKIGDGGGNIGIVEILLIMEPAHQPHADGHIGISRKIQVDLQHIAQPAQPQSRRRDLRQPLGGHGQPAVSQHRHRIGQYRLFGQPHRKTADAPAHFLRVHLALRQVLRHIPVPHNGPGNALVEQAGIQQQNPVFLLGPYLAAVYIHHIAD